MLKEYWDVLYSFYSYDMMISCWERGSLIQLADIDRFGCFDKDLYLFDVKKSLLSLLFLRTALRLEYIFRQPHLKEYRTPMRSLIVGRKTNSTICNHCTEAQKCQFTQSSKINSIVMKNKSQKKETLTRGRCLGIAERGGRTRSLKIKSLTLYRLS